MHIIRRRLLLPSRLHSIIHTMKYGAYSSRILTLVPRLSSMNLQKPSLIPTIWSSQISMLPRETDTLGISSSDLAKEAAKLGTDTHYYPSFAEIEAFLKENCKSGDLLITMGAGDVVKIGEDILK